MLRRSSPFFDFLFFKTMFSCPMSRLSSPLLAFGPVFRSHRNLFNSQFEKAKAPLLSPTWSNNVARNGASRLREIFCRDSVSLGMPTSRIGWNTTRTCSFSSNMNMPVAVEGFRAALECLQRGEKKIQVTKNLESNGIGSEGASRVTDALKANKTLQNLNLGGNKISVDGAHEIAEALKENSTLQILDLCNNRIGDGGAVAIGNAIRQYRNCALVSLDLAYNEIGVAGAKKIAGALENNSTLQTLNLDSNEIGADGAKEIAKALRKKSALQTLSLHNNYIGDDGVKEIAEALKKNSTLQILDLEMNQVGPEGCASLGAALTKNNTLTSLNLGEDEWDQSRNSIGNAGVIAIAEGLKTNTSLQELSLGGYPLLIQVLKGQDRKESLDLSSVGLKDDDIIVIGALVKNNTSLLTLNLDYNSIGVFGAKKIGEGLGKNSTLQSLSLRNNRIGQEGASGIADALKVNTSLQELYLYRNHIGPDGAKYIAEALKVNTSLQALNLSNNNLGENGAAAVCDGIRANEGCSLTELQNLVAVRPSLQINLVKQGDVDEIRKDLAIKVSSATARWGWCKLMVVGEGGAGKTQTIGSLLKEDFQREYKSTAGGRIKLAQIYTDSQFTLLKETERKDRNDLLILEAAQKVDIEMESKHKTAGENKEQKLTDGEEPSPKARELARERIGNEALDRKRREIRVTAESEEENRLHLSIWDFAGQDVYKAIHHLFLSTDGVYLLVFDMFKLLQSDTSEKSKLDLSFWIKSLRLFSPKARICFVGSHRDLCREDQLKQVDKILNELLTSEEIAVEERVFWETEDQCLLYFPIDNGAGELGRTESVVQDLREKIVSLARELESVNRTVPMRWILFLSNMWDRQLRSRLDYMSLEDFQREQQDFGIVEREAEEMLDFCHNMGVILNWNNTESTKSTIVLNPQWIIDAAARIIHQRELHEGLFDKNLLDKYRNDYDDMHKRGFISNNFLESVLWSEGHFHNKIGFLKALFETALLMCPNAIICHTKRYKNEVADGFIIPSLLRNNDFEYFNHRSEYVEGDWQKSKTMLEQKLNVGVVKAKLEFSWLPPGLFERLVCVCARKTLRDTEEPIQSLLAANECLYYVMVRSVGPVPVYLRCYENANLIEVLTVSGANISAFAAIQNIRETVDKILQDNMNLSKIKQSVFLVGVVEEFELEFAEQRSNLPFLMNRNRRPVSSEKLGLWMKELTSPRSWDVSEPSLPSYKQKDAEGRLNANEFAMKRNEWISEWKMKRDKFDEALQRIFLDYEKLESDKKRNKIVGVLETLVEGPVNFIAIIWKDALKQSGEEGASIKDLNKSVTAVLNDPDICVFKTVNDWIHLINGKIQEIITNEYRYGVVLSHQGIKNDEYGERDTLKKIYVSSVKQTYERELKFRGGKSVPVFFDNDSLIAGENQYEAMLFAVVASDKVVAFLDKDYCMKKWCLVEYFLAQNRTDVLMPFVLDNLTLPIPLPKNTVYTKMEKNSEATNHRVIRKLKNHFRTKNREDYTRNS